MDAAMTVQAAQQQMEQTMRMILKGRRLCRMLSDSIIVYVSSFI